MTQKFSERARASVVLRARHAFARAFTFGFVLVAGYGTRGDRHTGRDPGRGDCKVALRCNKAWNAQDICFDDCDLFFYIG